MKSTNKNKNNEKTLVIISAETREYQHTFERFKHNVLDELNADLALCVAVNHRENVTNPFYKTAKHIWQYQEPDDWGDAFDYATEQEGVDNNWRILKTLKDQWLGGIKGKDAQAGSAGILLFFRWLTKTKLLQDDLLDKYDRFIYTRSDYLYETPHIPLELLANNKIWIPDGEDYGGITDRYMMCNSQSIIPALSIVDAMLKTPKHLIDNMSFCNEWNLERYIKFSFEQNGLMDQVQRLPFTMYSLRSEGGHTSWSKGVYNEGLGYYVKYPLEYRSAQISKDFFEKTGEWNAQSIKKCHKKITKNVLIDTNPTILYRIVRRLKKEIKKLLSLH